MKEYEVKVTETKIVYVEANSEKEARRLAKTEAIHEEPEDITCEILSSVDLEDMDLTVCGELGCDGCLLQHLNDVELCRKEPKKVKHGKWIENQSSDHKWKCSCCNYGYTDYLLSYCYDCGAKMDLE